ncbi:hypothetical protein TrCOL_g9579 [Triparma columacea]|uniref:Uncharacterized protein n=1 Tax=Triparma columacea TaxID=722753 RepID=A0A9W7L2X0_9STRA|nr:hypothetical protein TrCOL_g9579 [Triparma columacea]
MNSDRATGFVAGCIFTLGLSVILRAPPPPPKARYLGLPNIRAASAVVHGHTVYLSGQVGEISLLESSDTAEQTRQTLQKIEKLLADAGTSKDHILDTQIWVRDMKEDFAAMNEVWYDWVGPESKRKGVRACVESNMARPGIRVEIKVTAYIP